MFVFTAKLTKGRAIAGAVAVGALIALLVTCMPEREVQTGAYAGDQAMDALSAAQSTEIQSGEEGAAYLAGLGWDAGEKPLEIREVVIPETFDEVYEKYNAMQKEEGYDLSGIQGERVTLYTYEIKNHPSGEEARANLLVQDNRLVGGDICSVKVDGFCHGLIARPEE